MNPINQERKTGQKRLDFKPKNKTETEKTSLYGIMKDQNIDERI